MISQELINGIIDSGLNNCFRRSVSRWTYSASFLLFLWHLLNVFLLWLCLENIAGWWFA